MILLQQVTKEFSLVLLVRHSSSNMLVLLLFFIVNLMCNSVVYSLKLPSYTLACSRNDPKLDECVVKHGQMAIPSFIDGDPRYRVPKLNPLFISELNVKQGVRQIGITLAIRNTSIYGLKDAIFTRARTNLSGQHIEWDFEIARLEIIGRYEVTGRVLILPVTGNGDANVTITDLRITYKYDWDYVIKKNGKKYMNITTSSLDYNNGRTYFQLDNLFGGDKLLGDNMNRFLNENWKEVTTEIGPAVGEAIAEVFRIILTSIADLVPWEYIYPDV